MSTPIDFPNSPSANDEFVASGKAWTYVSSVWKRYNLILTDGGYANTSFSVTDDGGDASGL